MCHGWRMKMPNNNEEYYTDSKTFFDSIKAYAKEINGTVLMAD